MKVVERGRADFQSLLLDYDAENIFNLDELALFWKALPDRTLMVRKGEKGGKRSKSRITVVLITNMSGTEKLTPILIGKAKCPRCWTPSRVKQLPVKYMDTKKAWMTGALFEDVLLGINMYFRKLGRKIVLIVDGAGQS